MREGIREVSGRNSAVMRKLLESSILIHGEDALLPSLASKANRLAEWIV